MSIPGRYVCRVTLLACLAVFLLAGNSHALDRDNPFLKKHMISIKRGRHIIEESDYMNFWEVENNTTDTAIAYERKLWRYIGLELAAGYAFSRETSSDLFLSGDTFSSTVKNLYVSASGKLYLPALRNSIIFYAGGGPDFYHTSLDAVYNSSGVLRSEYSEVFNVVGGHALAGLELIIIKDPKAAGEYDAPLGLFVEHRYSAVLLEEADGGIIDDFNNQFGISYTKHEFNIGGHTTFLGLRWHF